MLEIRPFRKDYIDEAVNLFAKSFKITRIKHPLVPERQNIVHEVSVALLKLVEKPGVAAFRRNRLVGYMLETDTSENFMSKKTAFCIDLCAHCSVEEEKELIYQKMYEKLSRVWVSNQYHAHEISYFAKDDILSFTFYRLGFGMTHFELLRDLNSIDGNIADVPIKKLDSEAPIRELNKECHLFYPSPPLFWIPHSEYDEEQDGVLSGHLEVLAAFDGDEPIAYFSMKKGTAESCILDSEKNGRIMGAYAKEQYRHKRIGKALLQEVINWARDCGCRRLYVEGESANIYGGNFWIKHFTPAVFSVRRCIDERVAVVSG